MLARLCIAIFFCLKATVVLASLPSATGDISSLECRDAIKLARAMFQSTAPRLYAPLTMPVDFKSTLVLGASELDISSGGVLGTSEDFERIPEGIRSIYWARETNAAMRVVVREIPHGWRGDMYELYLLDDAITKDDFLSSIGTATDTSRYQAVVAGTWRPPLVFQHPGQTTKWFIDVGQPFNVFSDWRVFSSNNTHALCTITFKPQGINAEDRLPRSMKKLIHKLDEALGPKTLWPAARTKLDAQYILANAALRPWALIDRDAYNTRSEVDAGLEDWAKANRSHALLYREITSEYPAAEHALAAYYVNTYGLSPRDAGDVAIWVLDLAFRSFFVFSNGQDNVRNISVRTNPWPMNR